MLKLEIKLDDEQIILDTKYSSHSIYHAIDRVFSKYHFHKEEHVDGTICYYGNGATRDYGVFGKLNTQCHDAGVKRWFPL